MVRILAARRSRPYAAGHGFHSLCPYSILGHFISHSLFSHHIICILPRVSPFALQALFGLTFCPYNRPTEVVICSPSHNTHYSRIVQSCYSSPDRRLTLAFRCVLCSPHDHLRFISSIACTLPLHTYASVLLLIMSHHSTATQSVDWPFLPSISVHCERRSCSVCIIHQHTRSKDKRLH
jgi:hypothetical protein